MVSLQCAICSKKQKLIELYPANFDITALNTSTFSARRIPDKVHFRFVKCVNCGLIFSSPILLPSEIENLYRGSDFKYNEEVEFLKKTYGFYLEKVLASIKVKKIKLLDIGCGNGFFLEEAKAMGVEDVYGIEPGEKSVKKAKKWLQKNIKIGFFDKKSYKNDFFDIICCFQTLDHIIDPNTFLQDVYAKLKPNGKALFILHNTKGSSVQLFGEKSPIFDIEHMYLFNKTALAKIFSQNKFRVVETFDVKNRYPVRYWMKMSPLPGKKLLLGILEKVGIAHRPIALNAGNIGIIVEK